MELLYNPPYKRVSLGLFHPYFSGVIRLLLITGFCAHFEAGDTCFRAPFVFILFEVGAGKVFPKWVTPYIDWCRSHNYDWIDVEMGESPETTLYYDGRSRQTRFLGHSFRSSMVQFFLHHVFFGHNARSYIELRSWDFDELNRRSSN